MEAKQVDCTSMTLYDNGYTVFQTRWKCSPQEQMKSVLESLQFFGDVGRKVGNIAYEETKYSEPLVGLLRSLVGPLISVHVRV